MSCILLLALAASCGSSADASDPEEGRASPVAEAPPDESHGHEARIWFTGHEVPPGSHEVVAVYVESTEPVESAFSRVFGLGADVDRWDGTQWTPYGRLNLCAWVMRCSNAVVPLDSHEVSVDEGISPGEALRFSTAGLDQGYYRISQTIAGRTAVGVLRVVEGAESPPPLPGNLTDGTYRLTIESDDESWVGLIAIDRTLDEA